MCQQSLSVTIAKPCRFSSEAFNPNIAKHLISKKKLLIYMYFISCYYKQFFLVFQIIVSVFLLQQFERIATTFQEIVFYYPNLKTQSSGIIQSWQYLHIDRGLDLRPSLAGVTFFALSFCLFVVLVGCFFGFYFFFPPNPFLSLPQGNRSV